MNACRRWNEKPSVEKAWAQFKTHFAAAHRQHQQMQDESATTSGNHPANAAVGKTEEKMAEATIGALANLATVTAVDRGVVATLGEANTRLVKQLEDNSNELRELKALLSKERTERIGQRSFNPSPNN
jgi:phage shock protein A